MVKNIDTLLFDLDGTLIDSREDLANAVNFALSEVGQPPQVHADIIPHVGNGLRVLLSEVLGPVPTEVLDASIRSFSLYYDEHCLDKTVLYQNVKPVLFELAQSCKMAVVTNKPERFSRKIIGKLGLSELFGVVIGGDTLAERKPHPRPVMKALTDLNRSAESSLFIGDGIQDIQAAQAAGVRSCVVKYGYGFQSSFLSMAPDFQIDGFSELKEIVS